MDSKGKSKVAGKKTMMKKFLTLEEAADYLGLPATELQKLSERSKVPTYKIGGIYTRFRVDDLNLYRRRSPRRRELKEPRTFLDGIKEKALSSPTHVRLNATLTFLLRLSLFLDIYTILPIVSGAKTKR